MNPIYNPKNRDFSSCVALTLVTLLVFATAASTSITFADKSADRSGAADEKNNKDADSNINDKEFYECSF